MKHPVETAEDFIRAFEEIGLRDTAYAKLLTPALKGLVQLHKGPLPWSVRFSALVTGRIPKSYLEDFSADL